jgi:ATP-binding cassette subfamily B protein
MKKDKGYLKVKIETIGWAFSLAWKFDKKMLLFWYGLSISLAILPAIALEFNREVIFQISTFLSNGSGSFQLVVPKIIILGIILTAIGLSARVNADLIYMMMYDKYYFGMEEMMMESVQRIDMKYLLNKDVKDEYLAVVNREGSLTDFMSSLCTIASKTAGICSLLVVAYSTSKVIFFVSLAYIIGIIILNASFVEKIRLDAFKIRNDERMASYYEGIPQSPSIAKEIRIFETKDEILKGWERSFEAIFNFDKERSFAIELRTFVSSIGFYIFMIIMIVYSIYNVANRKITPDIFIMIYALCINIFTTVSGIAKGFMSADYGLMWLERQHSFFKVAPVNDPRDELNKLNTPLDEEIVFEAKNLNFGYNESQIVLNNISFKIKKGEVIALVGYNGSGKSTLVKLLLGLYKPITGELHFCGRPYSEYKQSFIRNFIGVFFQDFYLFHASLRENIGFGDLSNIQNDDKIYDALGKGGAEKVLKKLKNGLNQLIGRQVYSTGAELSGGEKQRIAVSRAHMSDKDIMIFDEPAAMIDSIAEMEQFFNIRKKLNGRTAILVSHRVGFARLADRIIVLNNGRVEEDGSHDELMQKNGVYADFFNQQAHWYDKNSKSKEVLINE